MAVSTCFKASNASLTSLGGFPIYYVLRHVAVEAMLCDSKSNLINVH